MSLQLLTIQHWLSHHAKYRADHPAFICGKDRLSYRELNDEVTKLANAFIAAGIQKGDKVATVLHNCRELYETYWACAAIGAVAVPLSPLLRGQALSGLLTNADVKLVVTCIQLKQHVGEKNSWFIDGDIASYHTEKNKQPTTLHTVAEVSGDDAYNIIYSSGTTGLPKGIVISHAVRALYGALFANAFRMKPESVVMHSGSIIFNGSFLTLMPAMYLGCTYILQDHFDAKEVVNIIHEEKITHTILVPSQIINCLHEKNFTQQHLPHLEYVLSVGAPLLQEHKDSLNERIPGTFYELYGLTEGFMTILDKNDVKLKSGSVGRPPQFSEMKIIDDSGNEQPNGKVGEIIGRGPLLMTGYYKNPEQTADALRQGWLYTGDLGYVDDDGFLFLTGRKKDLIISGGVNVYPTDIEEIIIRNNAVKDVAVFGVPHKEWGETPVAAIVLKDNNTAVQSNELKDWINRHIDARYQKIHDVIIIPELPRNIAGKILKRELKEQYINQHA